MSFYFIRNRCACKLHVVLEVLYLFRYRNRLAIRTPAEKMLPDAFCDSCQQSAGARIVGSSDVISSH